MIHYQLRCDQGHGFDGWFRDSISFDQQAASGLVACPICSSTTVARALMTPALGRGSRKKTEPAPPQDRATASATAASEDSRPGLPSVPTEPSAPNLMPDGLRSLLHRLRSEVEKTCDYVGTEFAEEARRIHYGEKNPRSIYGEATQDQAEALADEGIAFGVIPWLPRTDS